MMPLELPITAIYRDILLLITGSRFCHWIAIRVVVVLTIVTVQFDVGKAIRDINYWGSLIHFEENKKGT